MGVKYYYNFCVPAIDETDLNGDILSAVRRSYFEGFERIRDKITADSEGASLTYDYDIEKGRPLKWLVKAPSGEVLQRVEPSENDRYNLCFYRGEALFKRLIFSKLHTLLRIEYFDDKGAVSCFVEPRKVNGEIRLLYSDPSLSEPAILSEAPAVSDIALEAEFKERFTDYTVAASTNDGIVYYLTDDQLAACRELIEAIENEFSFVAEESFIGDEAQLYNRINVKDFNVKRNLSASLDISEAKEFDYDAPEDAPGVGAQPSEDARLDTAEDAAEPETEKEETFESPSVKPDKQIMADGAVYSYYGELDDNGDRSGYGRTLTNLGRIAYEGEYLGDKRSGKGAYFYKDGTLCYSGDWSENARHGVGVGVSARDGSIHVGHWVNNKPEGNGVRLSSDGSVKFVCKELEDGTTVLMNYLPDETVLISKYDSAGKKTGEKTVSLTDFS